MEQNFIRHGDDFVVITGNAPWSDKEYEILKKYYPTIGSEVALILGKTKRACNTKAHKLGIKIGNC